MTLEQLIARRDLYLRTELRLLEDGQEMKVGDGSTARTYREAELRDVQAQISSLNAEIAVREAAENGSGGCIIYLGGV